MVFVAPQSIADLKQRSGGRDTEPPAELARRLRTARTEIANIGLFQYVIVNDRLDEAIDELEAIYRAECVRLGTVPWRSLQKKLLEELEPEL